MYDNHMLPNKHFGEYKSFLHHHIAYPLYAPNIETKSNTPTVYTCTSIWLANT